MNVDFQVCQVYREDMCCVNASQVVAFGLWQTKRSKSSINALPPGAMNDCPEENSIPHPLFVRIRAWAHSREAASIRVCYQYVRVGTTRRSVWGALDFQAANVLNCPVCPLALGLLPALGRTQVSSIH